jgi:tetratricopeptide (TPR) repeat protein
MPCPRRSEAAMWARWIRVGLAVAGLGAAALAQGAERAGPALIGSGEIEELIRSGRNDRAREAISRSLAASPDDPRLYYLLAYLEMQERAFEAAGTAIDRALALDPAFPGAHLLRGMLLERTADTAGALAEFRDEVRSSKDPHVQWDANTRIAVLAREAGRDDEAVAALHRILALDPAYRAAYRQLIDLYTRTGNDEALVALLAKAPSDISGDATIHFNVAAAHWNRGEPARAAAALARALEVNPNLAEAHRLLGHCRANLADFRGAVVALERYLELAPGADDAAEVRELIESLKKKG